MTYTGKVFNVKNLLTMSCFGRIQPDDGGRSLFVSAVNCDDFKLEDGMHVEYEIKKGTRNNYAVNIKEVAVEVAS